MVCTSQSCVVCVIYTVCLESLTTNLQIAIAKSCHVSNSHPITKPPSTFTIINVHLGNTMPAPQHTNQHWNAPQNMSHIFSRYRDYLKSYYSNYSVARDDKLSAIDPCSHFINLALIKKERSLCYDHFSRSTFHGGVDEIVASKTPLEIDALVTPDSRFVLVEGSPGIGKSTLCWELCRK